MSLVPTGHIIQDSGALKSNQTTVQRQPDILLFKEQIHAITHITA